jgi:hypothetical protein
MTARLLRFPGPLAVEPWLSKREIATHLRFSVRWVELRVNEGMPCERWGGRLRFRASEVEAWLRGRNDDR